MLTSLSRQCAFVYTNAFEFGPRDFDAGEILPPFLPPPNFPQSDLGRRADSRWALPQISSSIWSWLFIQAVQEHQCPLVSLPKTNHISSVQFSYIAMYTPYKSVMHQGTLLFKSLN